MDSKVLKTLELIKGKEINLQRRHPWVFSGALSHAPSDLKDGEIVYVNDYKKQRRGFGHFHNGSIAIKMLSFKDEDYEPAFWEQRLKSAYEMRMTLFPDPSFTNCFRWIHGEGDDLPGLIIDVYDTSVIIQCHTIGMHKNLELITDAIKSILSVKLTCVLDKSKETLPVDYAKDVINKELFGIYKPVVIKENAHQFEIDSLGGQKTGFFLDQRENRNLLAKYANGKTILNTYCYSGGFSIYGLGASAKRVVSIDVSKAALELLDNNLKLNDFDPSRHFSICSNVNDYLKDMAQDEFEIVILDPPAFAKSLSKKHNAIQAYKRINLLAMKKIRSKGLLFTFSCSQVIDERLFYNTIVSAGIESQRKIKVLHKLSQGPDHPVSLFHPEGSYLKGLVLQIE